MRILPARAHLENRRLAICALALGVALTACGADDSAAPSGTGGPGDERPCRPINPDLEAQADQGIDVATSEFSFGQDAYLAEAGTITFEVANKGNEEHELAFLPGGGPVPYTDGEPDEARLAAAGAFELEAFGPGQSCNATYELAAGEYTLFCIVRTADGETHYDNGMRSTLSVT